MRKFWLAMLAVLLLVISLPVTALAIDTRSADYVEVPADQVVEDDVTLAGDVVMINGTINGDVFAAAKTVVLNGSINGSFFVAAQDLDLKGVVNGTVAVVSETATISGRVSHSVVSFGSRLIMQPGATVDRSLITATDRVTLNGSVGRGIAIAASRAMLNGSAGKEVKAYVDQLEIGPDAKIAGEVSYTSQNDAIIAPGARTGQVVKLLPQVDFDDNQSFFDSTMWRVASILGFMLVGFVVFALFPGLRESFPAVLVRQPWQVPLTGFLAIIASPILFVLLLLTVIGIPVALLMIPTVIVLGYLAQVFIAWTLVKLLADRFDGLAKLGWTVQFVIGTALFKGLTLLPFFGDWISGISGFRYHKDD